MPNIERDGPRVCEIASRQGYLSKMLAGNTFCSKHRREVLEGFLKVLFNFKVLDQLKRVVHSEVHTGESL